MSKTFFNVQAPELYHEALPVFSIETTIVGESEHTQNLTYVSVKAAANETPGLPNLPDDWSEQLSAEMKTADIVVPEYFRPEIDATTFSVPALGRYAVNFWQKNLTVFDTVADLAKQHGSHIAVADPANKPAYLLYEAMPAALAVYWISSLRDKGVMSEHPDKSERLFPTVTDARRMFTAMAIRRLAEELPSESSIMYVGQPAHVERIKKYVSKTLNFGDLVRFAEYKHDFPGIDKTIRRYEQDGNEWVLNERTPITLPTGQIGVAKYLSNMVKSVGLIERSGKKPQIG